MNQEKLIQRSNKSLKYHKKSKNLQEGHKHILFLGHQLHIQPIACMRKDKKGRKRKILKKNNKNVQNKYKGEHRDILFRDHRSQILFTVCMVKESRQKTQKNNKVVQKRFRNNLKEEKNHTLSLEGQYQTLCTVFMDQESR